MISAWLTTALLLAAPLVAARRMLVRAGISIRETPAAARSVFVLPAAAHGLWLELREGP
jgi:hypothetical protein